MQQKDLKTASRKKMAIFLFLFICLLPSLYAQNNVLVIDSDDTWDAIQTLTTSVVVKNGATLTINQDVLVHYIDVNGDKIGDITLTVEDGAKLVIASGVKFTRSGTNPPEESINKHWGGIILKSAATSSFANAFTVEYANVGLAIQDITTAADIEFTSNITFNNCNSAIKVPNFTKKLTFSQIILKDISGSGIDIKAAKIEFTNGFVIDGIGAKEEDAFAVKLTSDEVTIPTAGTRSIKNVTGNGIILIGKELTIPKVTIEEISGIAMEIRGNNISLVEADIKKAEKGILINGENNEILYSKLSEITENGIEIKETAKDILLDWLEIDKAGTGIFNEGDNVEVTNTQVTNGTKSGLFNKGKKITVFNSAFNDNAFHGVVNTGDILEGDKIDALRNHKNGFVAAGSGKTKIENSSTNNNQLYGFEITGAALTEDILEIPTGAAEHPEVSFKFSNIIKNSGKVDTIQVKSSATNDKIADFSANWWGTTGEDTDSISVDDLVETTEDNSVYYENYRMVIFGQAHSTFSEPKSLKLLDLFANYTVIVGEELTINWETVGSIPNVKVTITNAGGDHIATIPNKGTYKYTIRANDTNIKIEDATGTATNDYDVTAGTGIALVAPITGSFYGGDTLEIKWGMAPNVSEKIKIEYDKTGNFTGDEVEIAEVDGTEISYKWVANNENTATAKIKLTNGASTNTGTAFTIIPRPVITKGGLFEVKETDNYMVIHIDDVDLLENDGTTAIVAAANEYIYLGAFYKVGDKYKCAGWTHIGDPAGTNDFTDDNTDIGTEAAVAADPVRAISIWGDDSRTTEVDGFTPGGTIYWKIWREDWGSDAGTDDQGGNKHTRVPTKFLNADGTDFVLAPNTFNNTYNPSKEPTVPQLLYQQGAGSTTASATEQVISIKQEWSYISSYIKPGNATISNVTGATGNMFAEGGNSTAGAIAQGIEAFDGGGSSAQGWQDFVILKNDEGKVHWALDPGTNSNIVGELTTWVETEGYMLKMVMPSDAADTNRIVIKAGNAIDIGNPIPIKKGWNLIPYYGRTDKAITECLSSIAYAIEIVKDQNGLVYWPQYTVNTIENMKVGEAYWVKAEKDLTLKYPKLSKTSSINSVEVMENEHYITKTNSDNSAVLGILEDALRGKIEKGDEIGVFNQSGELVGSTVYTEGNIAFAVWGIENGKTEGFGMANEEPYEVRVWQKRNKKEVMLQNPTYINGEGVYKANQASVIGSVDDFSSSVPSEFQLNQNYPNPFNPSTVIKFALPKATKVEIAVYNVLGQLVTKLVDSYYEAGYHEVTFDASNISSGVYIYQIKAGDFVQTRKMSLLK